jgi:hypothetical protein
VQVGAHQLAAALLRKSPAENVCGLADAQGRTLLAHVAASPLESGYSLPLMTTLTTKFGYRYDAITDMGETLLHLACARGHLNVIRALLENVAVGKRDLRGMDAMAHLLSCDDVPVQAVEALLAAGGDINSWRHVDMSALASLEPKRRQQTLASPPLELVLARVASKSHPALLEAMKSFPAGAKAPSQEMATWLEEHAKAMRADMEVAITMLQAGADWSLHSATHPPALAVSRFVVPGCSLLHFVALRVLAYSATLRVGCRRWWPTRRCLYWACSLCGRWQRPAAMHHTPTRLTPTA